MKNIAKVLVVGELLADIISEFNIESLASPSRFLVSQGGSSANLCANLKWLGVDAELIATVGNDNLGTYLIRELKSVGIADTYISRTSDEKTSIVLVGKNSGTPDFIAYRSADMIIKRMDENIIEACGILHTTAFALSKEPARSNILHAFEKAYQLGKYLSVDWNYAPSIWQEDDGKDVFKKLMKMNPLLKISVDDLERFTGESLNIEEAVKWLDNLNAQIICLTCGKDGVWFKTKNQAWQHKPALPVNSVIGVTGAGDAFWSGFLSAFVHEKSIDECISQALEVAKLKIEKPYPLYKK
ncbi:carbohydrate kinase family protein [uncultured Pedobacter sp.]|uniref:carbohydrate kinase family protein n=1 Tax=uncultured Pedobacter sp. TaxID=246139 RepID=UPI0025F2359C|nr:carbohydrate kinase family protein [uncultured Pedobacter sp.]